jgi:hypothetical protein
MKLLTGLQQFQTIINPTAVLAARAYGLLLGFGSDGARPVCFMRLVNKTLTRPNPCQSGRVFD